MAAAGEQRRGGAEPVLTSAFAALLHPVLVDVQREEHVRIPVVILLAVLLAAPPGGDGGVQEEGGLLGSGGPQLALVLQLEGRSRPGC